jgi:oxygen-independent coproporphyrinogen-3 oxidase
MPLDDNKVAQMYNYAMDYLSKAGFVQYEVSNFAKKGYSCKHNENYWKNNSYIGLGPSAVSYRGGLRERNVANIKKYIEKVRRGESPVIFKEKLSALRRARETASLKIRTKDGIDFSWFKKKTGFDFLKLENNTLNKIINDNLIEYTQTAREKTGVHLTKKGFLFCDSVCASFL